MTDAQLTVSAVYENSMEGSAPCSRLNHQPDYCNSRLAWMVSLANPEQTWIEAGKHKYLESEDFPIIHLYIHVYIYKCQIPLLIVHSDVCQMSPEFASNVE